MPRVPRKRPSIADELDGVFGLSTPMAREKTSVAKTVEAEIKRRFPGIGDRVSVAHMGDIDDSKTFPCATPCTHEACRIARGERPLFAVDRSTVEELVDKLSSYTECGVTLMSDAPTPYPSSRMRTVSWESLTRIKAKLPGTSRRVAIRATFEEALRHAIRFEEMERAQGLAAADAMHKAEMLKHEKELPAWMREKAERK